MSWETASGTDVLKHCLSRDTYEYPTSGILLSSVFIFSLMLASSSEDKSDVLPQVVLFKSRIF